MADYTKALELKITDSSENINPKFFRKLLTMAYLNRGKLKLLLGDKIGACLDLRKVGESETNEAQEIIKKYCK